MTPRTQVIPSELKHMSFLSISFIWAGLYHMAVRRLWTVSASHISQHLQKREILFIITTTTTKNWVSVTLMGSCDHLWDNHCGQESGILWVACGGCWVGNPTGQADLTWQRSVSQRKMLLPDGEWMDADLTRTIENISPHLLGLYYLSLRIFTFSFSAVFSRDCTNIWVSSRTTWQSLCFLGYNIPSLLPVHLPSPLSHKL